MPSIHSWHLCCISIQHVVVIFKCLKVYLGLNSSYMYMATLSAKPLWRPITVQQQLFCYLHTAVCNCCQLVFVLHSPLVSHLNLSEVKVQRWDLSSTTCINTQSIFILTFELKMVPGKRNRRENSDRIYVSFREAQSSGMIEQMGILRGNRKT